MPSGCCSGCAGHRQFRVCGEGDVARVVLCVLWHVLFCGVGVVARIVLCVLWHVLCGVVGSVTRNVWCCVVLFVV